MKQLIKKNIGMVSRAYHTVRSARPVWNLINTKGRKNFRNSPVSLEGEQKKLVEDLRRDGIAITHADKILPPGVFAELQKYAMDRWDQQEVQERYERRHEAMKGDKLMNKSFFLVDLWKGEQVLDLNNPFTKFSLSSPVLNVIHSYMNMWMKFTDWRLQVTVPMPEGMRSYASQDWHRDPEDQQLVKMFLYLNDVDENSGPFIYLKNSHIYGKLRHLFPQKPPRGSTGDDAKIPQENRQVCTGKAGTIIFCDTSGLHRGGHAKSNNRFMYTSIYESAAAVWPVAYKYPQNFDTSKLSAEAKFAVSNKIKAEPKYYKF